MCQPCCTRSHRLTGPATGPDWLRFLPRSAPPSTRLGHTPHCAASALFWLCISHRRFHTLRRAPGAKVPRWSEDEETKLRALVKSGVKDWAKVAAELGTGRSPAGVDQHWQILCGGQLHRLTSTTADPPLSTSLPHHRCYCTGRSLSVPRPVTHASARSRCLWCQTGRRSSPSLRHTWTQAGKRRRSGAATAAKQQPARRFRH